MENLFHHHGSVIALEGSDETVSTQLRLLPTSSQLLVLPSLQSYMGTATALPFRAASLIKEFHDAAQARQSAAIEFLRGSSPTDKRLVFLKGGTAGAVSQCISAISKHQTSGDLYQAELLFRNIALEGLRGLNRKDKHSDEATLWMLGLDKQGPGKSCLDDEEPEDQVIKAMMAADLLYRETDTLQPIDCYIRTRPRSLSLPLYGFSDGTGEASPFFVFGSAPSEDAHSNSGVDDGEAADGDLGMLEDDVVKLCTIKHHPGNSGEHHRVPDRTTICTGEHAYRQQATEMRSPTLEQHVLLSPPVTPDGFVYGEARLEQTHAVRARVALRETRSLDDLELEQALSRHATSNTTSAATAVPAVLDPEPKSRHLSTTDIRGRTTTMRRTPAFVKCPPEPARDSYVHRGTDAAGLDDERHDVDEPFEAVLPACEDLAIHLTSQMADGLLKMVFQYFKAGAFPVAPFSANWQAAPTDSCPSTPRTAELFDLEVYEGLSPVVEYPGAEDPDYDPFAARGRDVRSSHLALQPSSPLPPAGVAPDSRQPAILSTQDHRDREPIFHELSTAELPNAVAIQNALRSVLEVYFPPQQDDCHRQLHFPLLHDIGSLWRPILGHSEGCGIDPDEKTPDMILAIGRQDGVKREFLSAITGQIEKLGAKSSGMSRSCRLDLRYLIANAVQSFTARPLAEDTHNSRSENHYVLACLIIPHLETYLATSYGIRFLLLEYPAEHLATVMALQELVGMDVLKVATIIDSVTNSPSTSGISPSIPRRLSSESGVSSSDADANGIDSTILPASYFPDEGAKTPSSRHKRSSFSEANYVLTSSATDSEISVFISSILKLLIGVDSFYLPEISILHSPPGTASLTKSPVSSAGLPTLMSKFTLQGSSGSPAYTHTAVFGPTANLPLSPPYTNDGDEGSGRRTPRVAVAPPAPGLAHNFPLSPPTGPRSPSPSPSATSTRSRPAGGHIAGQGAQRSRSLSRRRLARAANEGGGDDGASMSAVSAAEDGEFSDEEEKRLMPMYMRQSELRKGNSQKALKWLGLA